MKRVETPLAPTKDSNSKSGQPDEYGWLEDISSSDTKDYLAQERAYTQDFLKENEYLINRLYEEIKGRIKLADSSVPYKFGDYLYYEKTEEDSEYTIICRKHNSNNNPEEIILDENELAQGHEFFCIGDYSVSIDGRYIAYTIDTTGNEIYALQILDLQTGEHLSTNINGINDEICFLDDNQHLLFSDLNEKHRPHNCKLLNIHQQTVKLCVHEPDDKFWLSFGLSKSRNYIVVTSANKDTTEVSLFPVSDLETKCRIVHKRKKTVEAYLEENNGVFYLLTNENAKNFRLLSASYDKMLSNDWQELIPHKNNITLEKIELFKDYLVVLERGQAITWLRIIAKDGEAEVLSFPEETYSIDFGDNIDPDSNILRYTYESLSHPSSVYDYVLKTGKKTLLKQQELCCPYNSGDFTTKRITVKAKDGTNIPVSLIYKNDKFCNDNPLLLYGYGAYGATTDPWFSSVRISLLNRGIVFAIAHIRGSGDCGRLHYDNGKLLSKKNTFTDFICCAQHLINHQYTSPDKLIISGGSAGGMLIGNIVNEYPNLLKAAILDVPFVDVLNTMLNADLPLTKIEYDEWGNPNEQIYYDYIKSYSPYDNVQSQNYPNLFITTGLHDYRVTYWEPTKFVAKLRKLNTSKNKIYLYMQDDAGHGGVSKRFSALRDISIEYAFIIAILGID